MRSIPVGVISVRLCVKADFFADLFHAYDQTEFDHYVAGRKIEVSRRYSKALSIQRHQYRSAQQPIFDWSRTPETELDDDSDLPIWIWSNELEFEFLRTRLAVEYLTTKACLDADPANLAVLRPMLRGRQENFECKSLGTHAHLNIPTGSGRVPADFCQPALAAAEREGYVSSSNREGSPVAGTRS